MVKKLVRLALACEHNRRAIRRDMIREKVLGAGATGSKVFKQVLEQAQVQLRSVFGMELMELPSREKVTAKQRRGMIAPYHIKPISGVVLTSCDSRPEDR